MLAAASAGHAAPHCGGALAGDDGWSVTTAPQRVFDAEVFCRTLSNTLADANLHGIVVDQGGLLQFEAYFEGRDNPGGALFSRHASFGPDDLHDLRSVTKSLTALLVGIALDRGKLASVEAPVLSFFPEHADLATPERSRITLEHLLTMSSGLDWDESGSYVRPGNTETRMRFSSDPDRFVLSRDVVAPPGTAYVYNGGGTALLGEVLVRRMGQPLDAFAKEALFEPLGITRFEWRQDRRDRVTPFGGLRLRPRDLAKIGRMLLDDGQWRGRQVVPPSWIAASFRGRLPAEGPMRYGYQWRRGLTVTGGQRIGWVAAFGNGGQRLFIAPALDLVVVVTAGNYNQPEISWRAPLTVFQRIVAELVKTPRAPAKTTLPD